jgi:hypothetical protein
MTRSLIRRPIAGASWPGTTRRAGAGLRVVIGVTHVRNLLCADACYAASAQMAASGLSHSARQLRHSAPLRAGALKGPVTGARGASPGHALMGVDRLVRWDRLISEPSAVSTGQPGSWSPRSRSCHGRLVRRLQGWWGVVPGALIH